VLGDEPTPWETGGGADGGGGGGAIAGSSPPAQCEPTAPVVRLSAVAASTGCEGIKTPRKADPGTTSNGDPNMLNASGNGSSEGKESERQHVPSPCGGRCEGAFFTAVHLSFFV